MAGTTLLSAADYLAIPREGKDELLQTVDRDRAELFQWSPMVAVEIVSPSNTAESIDRKIDAYLIEGGAEVRVIHPASHSMMVFRPGGTDRVTGTYQRQTLEISIDIAALTSNN